MRQHPLIHYTLTDEAPALATHSLLPILEAFTKSAGIEFQLADISLAGRLMASVSAHLPEAMRVPDTLGQLGELTQDPETVIIKLPNISASTPQLKAAIRELQDQGIPMPDYPDHPSNPMEEEIRASYDRVKGSAVNPVLREGNSDRRAPGAVKAYARQHPHSMGDWSKDSKTEVSTMGADDFRANERSVILGEDTTATIEWRSPSGARRILRDNLQLKQGEILDASFMRVASLKAFLGEQVNAAREKGVLFSLHLKATMMKVSDPILFAYGVEAYFKDFITKHAAILKDLDVNFRNGLGDLVAKMASLPADQKAALENDLAAAMEAGPPLAMVNSDKGITNLHVPSDIIIDASMPAMIRASGRMWNADNALQDTLAVIPDSSYAGVYEAVIEDCKAHGAYDPCTMGSVPNVGLMAQKAEEYGSHDKTFEIEADGEVHIIDASGKTLLSHTVSKGDIWRACQTRDAAVRDWIGLAVRRARESSTPAVFWLDESRAHDRNLITKVKESLRELDTEGLDLSILPPREACAHSLARIRAGKDTISVTGNVLRDYLTDLFPILEVGTSAKMLSIVPLMKGGGLFETGAGGSAPKHVQQLLEVNYLRWDSLGEFLAIAAAFEHVARIYKSDTVAVFAETLDAANTRLLVENKSPTRRLGGIDNRGSHFHLALYWAQALAGQSRDPRLGQRFQPLAEALEAKESSILDELLAVQGKPADIGGYYRPDSAKTNAVMRPSPILNSLIDTFGK